MFRNRKTATFLLALVFASIVIVGALAESGKITTLLPAGLQSDTMESSGITVKNITKEPVRENTSGDIQFDSTSSYEFTYFKPEDRFLISITGSPFERVRLEAEASFVSQLGIDKAAACKLRVSITTPAFANPDEAGNTYSLSFCE